jgi:hypothetical protein
MKEEYSFEELAPWAVLIIMIVGGVLRVFMLGSKGLWLDETFSVWLANHSVAEMLQWIARVDQHPPLYYLLLHAWVALQGDAPGAFRMLSALLGAATIPVVYLIGKRMSGVVVGLVATVLFAVSPINIVYAQEARMYTLLTFNAAVAIYTLVRLLTDVRSVAPIGSQFREYLHAWRTSTPVDPGVERDFSYQDETRNQSGWRGWVFRHHWSPIQTIETDQAWVALIIFSAATLLSHNTAVLFLLAMNLFVLGLMLYQKIKKSEPPPAFQAPSLGNWVKAQVGVFLLWSPWILAFIRQAGRVDQEFWLTQPGWDTVIQTFRNFLNVSAPRQVGQLTPIWILYGVVLVFGLVHFRKRLSMFCFLAALIAVPFAAELLVSIRRPIFIDRTLIWTTVPLFLLLAAGIAQLRYRLVIILVLGVFATTNVFSASDYFRWYQKEDWSYAAGFVAKLAQKDDLVLFNSSMVQIPFDYYFKTYEDQYSIQVEKYGVPEDTLANDTLEPKMTVSDIPGLISMLDGHKNVFLVYSHDSYTDPMGLIPQALASRLELIQQRDFYGVRVYVYQAP